MGGSINAVLRFLFDDEVMVLIYLDGAKGRLRCTIAYVVVGRAGIINAPKKIIFAFAPEDIGTLTVGPRLQAAALGREQGNGLLFRHLP